MTPRPAKQAQRVLVVGASGFTNLGDDAILAAMLDELRQALPGATFAIAGGAPDRLGGQDRVHGLSFDEVAIDGAMEGADLLIVGGGGFIYDDDARLTYEDFRRGRFASFFPYYRAAATAHQRGIPIYFYAVGVGPLVTPGGREITRDVLSLASAITVRDPVSLHELEAAGVSAPLILLTADPAVRLPSPRRQWARRPEGRVVGFIARVWLRFEGDWTVSGRQFFDRYLDWLAAAADHVVERWNATPVFLAGQRLNDDDLEVESRIIERMRHADRAWLHEEIADYETLNVIVGGLDALVSTRLHPLIMAAISAVPTIGITSRPKVRAFLSTLGLGELAFSPWLASDALCHALDSILANPEPVRERLRLGVAAQARAAERNPVVAADLLAVVAP